MSEREQGGAGDSPTGEAAKGRFIRRRAWATLSAHGYREVQPSPLDAPEADERLGPRGALALADGSELSADPVEAIAQVYARRGGEERFARWMTVGFAFDAEAFGSHRQRAWQAVAGAIFGAAEPAADAELAATLAAFAADAGLVGAEVVIGTLGDEGEAQRFLDETAELRNLRCADCRASGAPLRFLTCDDEGCLALVQAAPPLREFVGVPALKHHEAVLATLERSGFTVTDDPRLAFGLGRFNRTVIELRARADGQVVTVARAGRRDGLVAGPDKKPLPTVGLTIGVARAAACLPGDGAGYELPVEVFFAVRGAAARAWALKAAASERSRGFRVDVELREVGWAEQLQRAERQHARVVVVAGDVERKRGEVAIRDMHTRETRHIPEAQLSAELKRLLR